MNQELKIGYLFSALSSLSLIFLIYLIRKSKFFYKKEYFRNIVIYTLFIFALFISLIIGERANLVKFTIILMFIFIFFEEKYKLKRIISVSVSVIFLIVTFGLSQIETRNTYTKFGFYKYRIMATFVEPLSKNPIEFIKQSNYGNHYKAGFEIFRGF